MHLPYKKINKINKERNLISMQLFVGREAGLGPSDSKFGEV